MTDPTSGGGDYGPQGGPGYGGGFNNYGRTEQDPYAVYGNYSPYKVQEAIRGILDVPIQAGHHFSQAALITVFSLMNTYGQQTVGFDAEIQNKMNAYIGDVNTLNQDLHVADVQSSATNGESGAGTSKFLTDLQNFLSTFSKDPFFGLAGQSAMQGQITASMATLSGLASGAGGLERLWAEFNGKWDSSTNTYCATGAPSGGSDPTGINSVTSTTGMLGSQLGGVNKGVLATTQYDTSLTTTEQDTFNNFMKKVYSLYLFVLGQMKTQ
jgi:hypothetical protein